MTEMQYFLTFIALIRTERFIKTLNKTGLIRSKPNKRKTLTSPSKTIDPLNNIMYIMHFIAKAA